MKDNQGHLINMVQPGSPASFAGIKAGWRLLRIDGRAIEDIIDYRIMEADDSLKLLFLTEKGFLRRVKINKKPEERLGLGFEPPTINKIKRCGNKCIFCFIDQNPSGLRPSLYLKDDDYRLSFLYGNFITLNRISAAEIERIISLQLSPLYISVHTTDPKLRRLMFGNKNAGRGLLNLKKLVEGGIKIHAQIVLCPGYNTGPEMVRTVNSLDSLGFNLLSVAIVPVGLTAYRHKLTKLKRFTADEAETVVGQIENLQKIFLDKRKSRFVFLADEFYLMAGKPFPEEQEYEGYPQLENGVGLARLFLNELADIAADDKEIPQCGLRFTIAAGKAAEPMLEQLVKHLRGQKKIEINMIAVENYFFGRQVTVSGLLAGSDLIAGLKGEDLGDVVFIANSLLKEGSTVFLDNITVAELENVLEVNICPVSGPLELLRKIRVYCKKAP